MTNDEKMLEEYKAEEKRHKQAISEITKKYNPDKNRDVYEDRRFSNAG